MCLEILLINTTPEFWLRADPPTGETVLHAAVQAPECVRLILEYATRTFGSHMIKDFVNIVCEAGQTALLRAVAGGVLREGHVGHVCVPQVEAVPKGAVTFPPPTGILYFPHSPEQCPVQWVLRTIAQK